MLQALSISSIWYIIATVTSDRHHTFPDTECTCGVKAQVSDSTQMRKHYKRRKTPRLTVALFNNAQKHNISAAVIRLLRPQGLAPV